jgi:hypothetical protein
MANRRGQSLLTDNQWKRIEPFLPTLHGYTERRGVFELREG